MFDVITVGSATVDVFAESDAVVASHKKIKSLIFPLGSKILLNGLQFHVGGGGTNTGVAFSRLGLKAAYLGNLGKDHSADLVLNLLNNEKISFIGTQSDNITNYSIILDSKDSDRTILVYKDASAKLSYDKIKKSNLKTKWFYFSSLVKGAFKTQCSLANYAVRNNIKVAFNPSSYQAKKGLKYIMPVLKKTNILILNAEEACLLLRRDRSKRFQKNVIKSNLSELASYGPSIVAITKGSKGVDVFCSGSYIHSKAKKVRAVETTGAGDAFASSFVAGIIMGKPIGDAVKMGQINAESVVCNYGAKNVLLRKSVLMRKLKLRG